MRTWVYKGNTFHVKEEVLKKREKIKEKQNLIGLSWVNVRLMFNIKLTGAVFLFLGLSVFMTCFVCCLVVKWLLMILSTILALIKQFAYTLRMGLALLVAVSYIVYTMPYDIIGA